MFIFHWFSESWKEFLSDPPWSFGPESTWNWPLRILAVLVLLQADYYQVRWSERSGQMTLLIAPISNPV